MILHSFGGKGYCPSNVSGSMSLQKTSEDDMPKISVDADADWLKTLYVHGPMSRLALLKPTYPMMHIQIQACIQ